MMIQFGGKTPQDCGAAFVAPNATVLGDVVLEKGSSVWYGAVLRGDDGTLTLGENTNVQDNAVLHCDPGGALTTGLSWYDDLAKLGGAGTLVPEGMVIPDGSVAVGVPAKIIKTIRPDQAVHNIENAVHYVSDAEAHAEAVKQCEIIETEAKTK